MKKEEILRVLDQEETRMRVYDDTPNRHNCTSRLAIRYVLSQERKDQQLKKRLISWRRIGGLFGLILRDVTFALGFVVILAVTAWSAYILWDFYSVFIHKVLLLEP